MRRHLIAVTLTRDGLHRTRIGLDHGAGAAKGGVAVSRIHALVPVKALADAKTRLAERFPDSERQFLVVAMLTDTLTAALASTNVDRVSVVTADAAVAAIARSMGAGVIEEPDSTESLNEALRWALNSVSESASGVLILQADLPALTASQLTAFTSTASDGHMFVADHHGTGTTALLLRAGARPLSPQFGPGSAARHRASGADLVEGDWPGLRHDVDTAADLDEAFELGVGPATANALTRFAKASGRS